MEIRLAFLFVLFLSALLIFVPAVSRLLSQQETTPVLVILFSVSRLAGWFGCYVLLDEFVRNSDLMLYYVDEIHRAYTGETPYVDYPSSYGPLFPYIAGVFYSLWNSPAAIALVVILVEIATVVLFVNSLRHSDASPPYVTNLMLVVYTVQPAALYWSGMMAYNSTFILFFWVITVLLLLRARYLASLMNLGFSLLASKFLGILIAPLLLAHPDRRLRSIVVAGAFFLSLLIVCRLQGIDLLTPLKIEGGRSTSGNIWFLLGGWVPGGTDGLFWRFAPPLSMLLSIGVFAYGCFRTWRTSPSLEKLCAAVSAVGWIFILLSKKTFPHYVPMFLLFTVYVFCRADGRRFSWVAILMVMGGIGVMEPGIWNALGQPVFLSNVVISKISVLLLILDLSLIATYLYCLIRCARLAGVQPCREPNSPAPEVQSHS